MGCHIDLDAILARVSGPRDIARNGSNLATDPVKRWKISHRHRTHRGDKVDRQGSLHGEECDRLTVIAHDGGGSDVLAHPCNILLPAGRVDYHHVVLGRLAIDDDVVDDPARLIAHDGIERRTVGQPGDVVGHQSGKGSECAGAAEPDLSHVGQVEEPGSFPNGDMLVADRGILLGHLVPPELNHPGPESQVPVVEGGPGSHGAQVYDPQAGAAGSVPGPRTIALTEMAGDRVAMSAAASGIAGGDRGVIVAVAGVVAVLLLLMLTPRVARRRLLRRSLPRLRGVIATDGIDAAVRIDRDRHGIPHVSAESAKDAAFAMGLVHGQDRLFQLELTRRVASGRISEFAGTDGLASDRFVRRVGIRRTAEHETEAMDGETRTIAEAYAAGVNFAVASAKRLPVEFTLLKITPEPWTIVDSLCCARLLALGLSTNWDNELQRLDLLRSIGAERAAKLGILYPVTNPTILTTTRAAAGTTQDSFLEGYREASRWIPMIGGGSNSWVGSGERTASGRPLLCNDPHLPPSLPSIWYAAHIRAGADFESTGVTFAGVPFVIIGHNRDIAWGFTNSFADCQDLVIEDFEDGALRRYRTENGPADATLIREVIRVKGGDDVVEEVIVTRHGPIVERCDNVEDGVWRGLALQWTALLDGGDTSGSLLRLQRAHDWTSFRAAFDGFDAPSQNVVYADREGHIGYTLMGRVPVRRREPSGLPVPGWGGDALWERCLTRDEMPHVLDPDEGVIVTANNRVVGSAFPHYIGNDYMNGYRALRIHELIGDDNQLTPDRMAAIQLDVVCPPALDVARLLREMRCTGGAERVRARLAEWNGSADANSVEATMYDIFMARLAENALRPLCGDHWTILAGESVTHPVFGYPGNLVGRLTPELLRRWREDDTTMFESQTSWRQVVIASLEAVAADPRAKRRWGRLHTIPLEHPLAVRPALRWLLNAGDLHAGGNTDTVLATSYIPGRPFQARLFTPSWRQIIDVGQWDLSTGIHAPGQSGQPGSRHFRDLSGRWETNQQLPLLWGSEAVAAGVKHSLTLTPRGQPTPHESAA